MKIERAFFFEAEEDRIEGDAGIDELFGVPVERVDFLLGAFDRKLDELRAADVHTINKPQAFVDFVASEPLTGREIALLCYAGYTAANMAKEVTLQMLSDPRAILSLISRHS